MLHYHYWSAPRTSDACLDIIEDYVSRFCPRVAWPESRVGVAADGGAEASQAVLSGF